jgi:hypothetical protein
VDRPTVPKSLIGRIVTRLVGLILILFSGQFFSSLGVHQRNAYWLRTDMEQGRAVLMKKAWSGHGAFDYRYSVSQEKHRGVGRPDWRQKPAPRIGDIVPVYFSTSHPWISSLEKPSTFLQDLPMTVFFLILLTPPILLVGTFGVGFFFLPSRELTDRTDEDGLCDRDCGLSGWDRFAWKVQRKIWGPKDCP